MDDGKGSPFELIRTIDDRYQLIELLREDGIDKPSLVNETDMSRSTVDRALNSLLDLGIVKRGTSGYMLTYPGKLIVECYEECLEKSRSIGKYRNLSRYLPQGLEIPMEVIHDANFFQADRFEPGLPHRALLDHINDAPYIWGIAPVFHEHFIEVLQQRLADEGRYTEIVTGSWIIEYFQKEYPETFIQTVQSSNVRILSTEELPEFGLLIIRGETACGIVMFYDDDHQVQGLLANDSTSALSWTREKYREVRDRSDGLTSSPR